MPRFSTLNESSLHRTLKLLYAEQYAVDGASAPTEQAVSGKICDIVSAEGVIIEIQTANLAQLAPKLAALVPDHPLRVVYPLVTTKYIETHDEDGTVVSCRKSPKKQVLTDVFRELTGIYRWILHENFTLEVLPVVVKEFRVRTPEPVQLVNRSRRFRRPWRKTDKALVSCDTARVFHTADDYFSLLPASLPPTFTARDLADAGLGTRAALMLWVLRKTGLVTEAIATAQDAETRRRPQRWMIAGNKY